MSEPTAADLLDQCIDALIAGKDWHRLVPATHPDREEIVQLMQLAEDLRDAEAELTSDSGQAASAKGTTRALLETRTCRP